MRKDRVGGRGAERRLCQASARPETRISFEKAAVGEAVAADLTS